MNHRERVDMALSHCEPDRIPIDFGGMVSSIMRNCYQRLCDYMQIHPKNIRYTTYDTVIDIDEAILTELDIDFRRVWLGEPTAPENMIHDDGSFTDIYGIKRKKIGEYIETILFPLANGDINNVRDYTFPDPEDQGWMQGVKEKAKQLHEKTPYSIVLGMSVDGLFESGTYLFGFEDFLVKLYREKKLVEYFLDKMLDFLTALYSRVLKEIGAFIDIIELGDDMANQRQLFFSPQIYREMIKPRHKIFFNTIHKHTNAKIFLHCCGSVVEIIDDLIEVGVDVLNPVQPSAYGMEARNLKNNFGDRICFHGGIDEQYYLPKANMDEFSKEVKRVINEFSPNGGYILAPAHNFQSDTPPEKIVTLYKIGKSPYSLVKSSSN